MNGSKHCSTEIIDAENSKTKIDLKTRIIMFTYLQKVGRSLMVPVSLLPAAAILMGIGYWIDPTGWGANNMLAALLIKSGGAIIENLSLLFAVGIAFGLSKDKNGAAALTGLVGFYVVTTLLSPATVALLQGVKVEEVPSAFAKINNPFIGILVGIIGAEMYNRFHRVQLHQALAFFSGKRLVPILMSFVTIALSYVLLYVWPFIFGGLEHFGIVVQKMGPLGAGIFGFANRLLIPVGLHHALYPVFWFDVIGINDIPNFLGRTGTPGVTGMYQAGFFPIMMGGLLGAALAFYHTAKPQNKAKVGSIMLAAGLASFFTGITEPLEFAFMFLAPPLYLLHAIFTGLSLYIAAKMQWMSGFGFSAGFVDFVLSSKNPMATKWYMLIPQGIAFFALYYFSFKFLILKFNFLTPGREEDENDDEVAQFSKEHLDTASKILDLIGGRNNIVEIDNCVTRLRLKLKDTSLIHQEELKKMVPGLLVLNEESVQIVVGPEADFIADVLNHLIGNPVAPREGATASTSGNDSDDSSVSIPQPGSHAELAAALLPLLGGKENITEVDNCITRLRLEVKDSSIINQKAIKKISSGLILPNKTSVQVIIGTEVEFVAEEFKKLV